MDNRPSIVSPDTQSSQPAASTSPPSTVSTPELTPPVNVKHAHKFIFGYIALILLVAIVGGVYSWQHKKVTRLNTQVVSLNSQVSKLNKQVVSLQATIKTGAVTKTTATSTATNPYAGWNTYTLPKEKLTFHYPTTWTVENNNFTNSNNDGIQFTSKTDSNFEILIGAGQDVAAVGNYDGSCVQQADPVTFDNQTAYLDLVGFANSNTVPPSCSPASSTIQKILLSQSSAIADGPHFFLTKNIPQPAAPSASEIIVQVDYNGPNGSTRGNKTISDIENDTDYKDAKLVVDSMSY